MKADYGTLDVAFRGLDSHGERSWEGGRGCGKLSISLQCDCSKTWINLKEHFWKNVCRNFTIHLFTCITGENLCNLWTVHTTWHVCTGYFFPGSDACSLLLRGNEPPHSNGTSLTVCCVWRQWWKAFWTCYERVKIIWCTVFSQNFIASHFLTQNLKSC